MSNAKITSWHFEAPISLNATYTANITWLPATFNSVNFGNFSLNLWLLRADTFTDADVIGYDPVLLAGNQNVFNNTVLWTPSVSDIDVNVSHAGTHQLAWERTEDNPQMSLTTSFKGFSKGFNVLPVDLPSSTSASSSTSSTSSTTSISSRQTSTSSLTTTSATSSTSATPSITNPPATPQSSDTASGKTIVSTSGGGVNQGTVIGLSVAFGGLALLVIVAITWWYSSRYTRKREADRNRLNGRLPTPPPYKEELDANGTQVWRAPSTPVVEIQTAEPPSERTHHELL